MRWNVYDYHEHTLEQPELEIDARCRVRVIRASWRTRRLRRDVARTLRKLAPAARR